MRTGLMKLVLSRRGHLHYRLISGKIEVLMQKNQISSWFFRSPAMGYRRETGTYNNCRRYERVLMALSQRRKSSIIALLIYWPALFVLAHIPIPDVIYRAGVSDKALHVLAYLVLVFLLWFAVAGEGKVRWNKPQPWLIILVVVWYGVIDELLQGYVGRNCDIVDFSANLVGVAAGLVLLSIVKFWPALLAVTGAAIFILANLARVNPAELLPVTSFVFYVLAYAVFTIVWVRYIHLFLSLKAPRSRWVLTALALPIALVVAVELFSVIVGRGLRSQRLIASVGGLVLVVGVILLVSLVRRFRGQAPSAGGFERSV